MIFTDRTVIVQKGTTSINDTIVLYRGDREVEIRFTLNESSPFKFGSGVTPNIIEKTEAAYGQLVIKVPGDKAPIFSEITATKKGAITFTITAEMIDEITEVGNYTFQIRLLDENKEGRVTIPEVVNGIEVREPIATEDISDTNEVGIAAVGYALTTAGTTEDTFDSQGNYNKTTWGTGDRITASKLNKIEAGIDGVNKKVASGGSSGGGTVDLSGYVTKETGNANQITFADGQTFQAKLDAGTLKGDKGDKGDTGATEAREVSIEDTGNNFVATNVENALAELFQITSELANKISQILGSTIKINSLNKLSNCKFKLINSTSDTNYNSIEEANKSFNDNSWNTVSIPHDWSIYNDFNQNSPASYDAGYLDGGDAWYRFKLNTDKLRGQKIYIYFDGVYMESDVYINGTKVKVNKWYNPFYVDATDYLEYDNNDVLAVFVRNQQPSSRWYSGSGIIRNVYLISANEIEVGLHDIKITSPDLSTQYNSDVTTNIGLTIKNETLSTSTYKIRNTIYYNNTKKATNTVNLTLDGNSSQYFTTTLVVNNPTLWDEYAGNLYVLRTELLDDWNNIIYSVDTYFGYRYFSFDKDTGFWLNGKNIKIRGVCLHHDLGCIGAEINKSAVERQIRLLKEMGCNAIRLTHNPASQEILDVCAKEGMLAVEEFFDCWTEPKMTYDFARYYNSYYASVIETTVKRGLNNPSIIMWSLGNEITNVGNYTEDDMNTLIGNMKTEVHKYDTSRPVTMGEARPGQANGKAGMALMDVIGLNYADKSTFDSIRSLNPNTPMYGSETTSALSSRGVYARDDANKQCSSFDDDAVFWGEFASSALKKHMLDISFSAGMFVWTGFDYIGEPTPFNSYPAKSSYFGIYDTCGFPKDIMYMYQSRWTNDPMIHILPHWDWESGNKTIWLYSNCYKVELFLNGTSLGSKFQSQIGDKYQFEYSVDYVKGTLVANGYNEDGSIVAQDVVYTSQGMATTTKLSSDKSSVNINSDDLIFVTCDIVDINGVIVPTANDKITFEVEGGYVIGTDNGNAACVEKYRSNMKSAFNGKVLCVVKHDGLSGNMIIKASGRNLTDQTITITKNNDTVLTQGVVPSFIDATNPPIYEYGQTGGDSTILSTATYLLDEASSFNGTNYIDTGVQLFDTDKGFTIYLDFKGGSDNALQNALLHCMNESYPWPGINLTVGNSAYKIDYMGGSTETNPLPINNNDTGQHKLFITKTSGTNAINIYVDGVELTQTLNGTMAFITMTQNLLIGAYQDSNGTKGRFWKGTVNRCAVWIDKVLNANEMSEVLS